jgi:hypothetical protein
MHWSRAITGLVTVAFFISLLTNVRRGQRIAALEARLAASTSAEAERETTRTVYADDLGRPDGPGDQNLAPDEKPPLEDVVDIAAELASEDPSLILTLPEVEAAMEQQLQDQLTERRKSWQNRHLEINRDSLSAYAEEAELDEEMTAVIDELMEETMLDIASLRQERHSGSLPDDQAFEELGSLRSDFREELIDMVGEDEAAAIQERLMGPLGRNYYDNNPDVRRPEER